jgi:predicted O-methyltransferase YrrM
MDKAATPTLTGTVFDTVDRTLARYPCYQAFRAGTAARVDLHRLIDERAHELQAAGVPPSDVPFMKRFPRLPHACVERCLVDLERRDIVRPAQCDWAELKRIERTMAGYDHGPFKTYIYPEEGLVLAAIAGIVRPRHAIFLGSYYGYWAHWALPAIAAAGGRTTLVDPSAECCAVAGRNLRANGLADAVDIAVMRGENFLADTAQTYDLVVLDAENPRDHPEPEQRGKRVYHSLTSACLPRLAPGALLVCHNILFSDATGDPSFAQVIARNRDELGEFAALVGRRFKPFVEYRTTEGVGIGRLTSNGNCDPWPIIADIDTDVAR